MDMAPPDLTCEIIEIGDLPIYNHYSLGTDGTYIYTGSYVCSRFPVNGRVVP